jgi:tellurite resistance protein
MNGKVSFGIDFLHAMLETNERSKESNSNVLALARVLLILEWGLNTQEQDEANQLFWKRINDKSLDDFSDVATRLIEHVKNIPEAKSKLLADLILVTGLDGDLSENEKEFIQMFGNMLDLRPSEIGKLAERADDISNAFIWFAKNNPFVSK